MARASGLSLSLFLSIYLFLASWSSASSHCAVMRNEAKRIVGKQRARIILAHSIVKLNAQLPAWIVISCLDESAES